jgi:chorismate mutase
MTIPLNIKPITEWEFGFKKPFIIAGPCSAESQQQVEETVAALAQQNVQLIRAGIWKPRTRPNSFEGVGEEGLKWLKESGKRHNLPVAIEVANKSHVEQALKAGIDILWIGARSTVNPFTVQEIADVLQDVDIPVMIKNPVNPDLELWIGAIERINKAGVNRIAAIHRGFSSYEKNKYRNKPNWEIPIELMRRMPNLPIVCDPSHICGTTETLNTVAQTAYDLNYDGLMIESHINPEVALSDAKQQVTPAELRDLLDSLIVRETEINNVLARSVIDELRDRIDKIDAQILDYIAERMLVCTEIGKYKRDCNAAILQTQRWDEIVKSRSKTGLNRNLNEDFIRKLFEIIHSEAIEQQANVSLHTTSNKDL